MVYSTCSIDAAENQNVIGAFLDRNRGLTLEKSAIAVPWIDRHDGAAAFLLRKA
jgi:16S rRNA (cytosine967-C5)-methyltransferase